MKRLSYVLMLFFVIIFTGCKKNATNPNPQLVADTIDMSKFEGIRYWHGSNHYSCWLCHPYKDSVYEIADTFGWILLDSSTIAKQDYLFYGYDEFTLVSKNETEKSITYESKDGNLKNTKSLTYFYKENKMLYEHKWSRSGDGTSGFLVTW